MFSNFNIKKVVLGLTAAMLLCFGISAVILFSTSPDLSKLVSTHTINSESSFSADTVQEIALQSGDTDIHFIPVDTQEIRVHYHGDVKTTNGKVIPVLKTEVKGNILEVRIKSEANMGVIYYNSDTVVDIYLPYTFTHKITAKTSSGDISFDTLNLEHLRFETYSGSLTGNSISAKSTFLKTSSGNCRFSESKQDQFDFESYSGELTVEMLITSGNTDLNTSSGNFSIGTLESGSLRYESYSGEFTGTSITAKKTFLKTSSGDMKVDKMNIEDLEHRSYSGNLLISKLTARTTKLDTSSGIMDISGFSGDLQAKSYSGNVSVRYDTFNNKINMETSSGDVAVKLPENSEFYLKARTSSGDINCSFPITLTGSSGEHFTEGTVVSDKNKINIRTYSGDIDISK